jgi:hypothetical protein
MFSKVTLVLQPVIISILQNRRTENELEDAEIGIEKTVFLYENIKKECNTVIDLIEKAITDIKERFNVN